jgi:hypothetical protein
MPNIHRQPAHSTVSASEMPGTMYGVARCELLSPCFVIRAKGKNTIEQRKPQKLTDDGQSESQKCLPNTVPHCKFLVNRAPDTDYELLRQTNTDTHGLPAVPRVSEQVGCHFRRRAGCLVFRHFVRLCLITEIHN